MNLQDAIKLIQPGLLNQTQPSTWADLGCGDGLFTIALSNLLKEGSIVYAVDENKSALNKIKPITGIELKKVVANFETDDLELLNLNGILMANSLHYVKDKITFLKKAITWMKIESSFIIVEYDTEKSNRWVPYPISFVSLQKLFAEIGFDAEKIGEQKSIYQSAGMYVSLASTVGV
jgi:ubiquinone/menaquinone biosynthesis C-methylase UbiE